MLEKIKSWIWNKAWEYRMKNLEKRLSKSFGKSAIFSISVENTNDHAADAVLFGYSSYSKKENYGSDKGVIVSSMYLDYNKVIAESQLKHVIEKIKLFVDNENGQKEIRSLRMWLEIVTSEDSKITHPIVVGAYFTPMQFQSNVVDIDFDEKRDGKVCIDTYTNLRMKLEPKQKLQLVFFIDKHGTIE